MANGENGLHRRNLMVISLMLLLYLWGGGTIGTPEEGTAKVTLGFVWINLNATVLKALVLAMFAWFYWRYRTCSLEPTRQKFIKALRDYIPHNPALKKLADLEAKKYFKDTISKKITGAEYSGSTYRWDPGYNPKSGFDTGTWLFDINSSFTDDQGTNRSEGFKFQLEKNNLLKLRVCLRCIWETSTFGDHIAPQLLFRVALVSLIDIAPP